MFILALALVSPEALYAQEQVQIPELEFSSNLEVFDEGRLEFLEQDLQERIEFELLFRVSNNNEEVVIVTVSSPEGVGVLLDGELFRGMATTDLVEENLKLVVYPGYVPGDVVFKVAGPRNLVKDFVIPIGIQKDVIDSSEQIYGSADVVSNGKEEVLEFTDLSSKENLLQVHPYAGFIALFGGAFVFLLLVLMFGISKGQTSKMEELEEDSDDSDNLVKYQLGIDEGNEDMLDNEEKV